MVPGGLSKTKGEQKLQKILDEYYPDLKQIGEYKRARVKIDFLDIKTNNSYQIFPRHFFENPVGGYVYNKTTIRKNGLVSIKEMQAMLPASAKLILNIDELPDFMDEKEEVSIKCPKCGYIKNITLSTLINSPKYKEGKFFCPQCADGISRPNKILRELLQFYNLKNLKLEYTPDGQSYRFDGYFENNGEKYLCEMDGGQHYNPTKFNFHNITPQEYLQKQKQIDQAKDKYAKDNGYIMIRINASGDLYDIKANIEKSLFADIVDLSVFDWDRCFQTIQDSMVIQVWDYYNQNPKLTTKQISQQLNISQVTVNRYLRLGGKCGYCKYNGVEVLKQNLAKASNANKKVIQLFNLDTGESQTFPSITDAAVWLNKQDQQISVVSFSGYIGKCLKENKPYKNYQITQI